MGHDDPKEAPRSPQEPPGWPQEGPRGPQDGPKRVQEGPKIAPRGPKMRPIWLNMGRQIRSCSQKGTLSKTFKNLTKINGV